MITRHDSLDEALSAVETRGRGGASTIVLNRQWWMELSGKEQDAYRLRAERAGVALRADASLSSHYVEVRGHDDGPSLSTEQPL